MTTHDVSPLDDTATSEPSTAPSSPEAASPPGRTDGTPSIDGLVAALRIAVAPGASDAARAAGAAACRALLATLDHHAGPQSGVPNQPPAPPLSPLATLLGRLAAMPREQLTALLAQLKSMPREKLLELALQHLRTALPQAVPTQAPTGLRFQLIPIPQARPGSGGT